jgi:hypothetical protein
MWPHQLHFVGASCGTCGQHVPSQAAPLSAPFLRGTHSAWRLSAGRLQHDWLSQQAAHFASYEAACIATFMASCAAGHMALPAQLSA